MQDRTWHRLAVTLFVFVAAGCSQTKTALRQMNRKLNLQKQQLEVDKRTLSKNLRASNKEIESREDEISDLKKELRKLKEGAAAEAAARQEEKKKRETRKVKLQEALKGADCEVVSRGENLVIRANVGIFSGGVEIDKPGQKLLRSIVETVNKRLPGCRLRIEGHTDDEPIQSAEFPSNWGLSGARALKVLHFMINRCSVPPAKLSFAGYGEHAPVVPNVDAESRERNRRVEIVVIPSQ